MKRIPFTGPAERRVHQPRSRHAVQMARGGGAEMIAPSHFPSSLGDLDLAFRSLFAYATGVGIPVRRAAPLRNRLLLLLTSCEKRRFDEYEHAELVELLGRRAAARPATRGSSPTGSLAAWWPPRRGR